MILDIILICKIVILIDLILLYIALLYKRRKKFPIKVGDLFKYIITPRHEIKYWVKVTYLGKETVTFQDQKGYCFSVLRSNIDITKFFKV